MMLVDSSFCRPFGRDFVGKIRKMLRNGKILRQKTAKMGNFVVVVTTGVLL